MKGTIGVFCPDCGHSANLHGSGRCFADFCYLRCDWRPPKAADSGTSLRSKPCRVEGCLTVIPEPRTFCHFHQARVPVRRLSDPKSGTTSLP